MKGTFQVNKCPSRKPLKWNGFYEFDNRFKGLYDSGALKGSCQANDNHPRAQNVYIMYHLPEPGLTDLTGVVLHRGWLGPGSWKSKGSVVKLHPSTALEAPSGFPSGGVSFLGTSRIFLPDFLTAPAVTSRLIIV